MSTRAVGRLAKFGKVAGDQGWTAHLGRFNRHPAKFGSEFFLIIRVSKIRVEGY